MSDETTAKMGATRRGRGRPRLDAEMIPRILDAAERLFGQRGLLEVSIRDIADEAGLPHSAIYRYFDGKGDLFRQVMIRGTSRQRAHEADDRDAGRAAEGAIDWIMNNNRAYALSVARAALEGETPSSLGIDLAESTAQASLRALEEGRLPVAVRTDHDPRAAVAAAMALALGWVVGERWIMEAAGLHECDKSTVRQSIDEIFLSVMALGKGARRDCAKPDPSAETSTKGT